MALRSLCTSTLLAAVLAACAGGAGGPDDGEPELRVAFTSRRVDDGARVFMVTTAGTDLQQVSDGPGKDYFPAWSPDGRWIAFGRNHGGRTGLHLFDVQTGTVTPLSRPLAFASSPAFSPDGTVVAFEGSAPARGPSWRASRLQRAPRDGCSTTVQVRDNAGELEFAMHTAVPLPRDNGGRSGADLIPTSDGIGDQLTVRHYQCNRLARRCLTPRERRFRDPVLSVDDSDRSWRSVA